MSKLSDGDCVIVSIDGIDNVATFSRCASDASLVFVQCKSIEILIDVDCVRVPPSTFSKYAKSIETEIKMTTHRQNVAVRSEKLSEAKIKLSLSKMLMDADSAMSTAEQTLGAVDYGVAASKLALLHNTYLNYVSRV